MYGGISKKKNMQMVLEGFFEEISEGPSRGDSEKYSRAISEEIHYINVIIKEQMTLCMVFVRFSLLLGS